MWIVIPYLIFLTAINGAFPEDFEFFCPEDWIRCGNGLCIPQSAVCDGEDDCDDMKDEENCDSQTEITRPPVHCPEGNFLCGDEIHCIPKKWVCDGIPECLDESDEANCDNSSICEGFQCRSLKCISSRYRCDGSADCEDGSDELNCTAAKNKCEISEGYYLCPNGVCLNSTRVCNGEKDCPNNEDEEADLCNIICNTKCSHGCIKTPNGSTCYCPPGFQLNIDNTTCIDIDECQIEGHCSQICKNTEGSALCNCYNGFETIDNTCRAIGKEPLMILSDTTRIKGLWLRSHEYFPIQNHQETKTLAMDYDRIDNKIYWTDHSLKNAVIYSATLENSDVSLVISSGLIDPIDLAVDWLARNIYIVDASLNSIIACKLDGIACTAIVENNFPRAIVLDPYSGLMYWTNWGKSPIIYRQGMDGSELSVFVKENALMPKDLALDVISKRLYWIDEKSKAIEKVNLDGSGRKRIFQDPAFSPLSLAVFEDSLYWADLDKYAVESCNKFTGKNVSTILTDSKLIGGIHIYHPVLYREDNSDLCWFSECSHICLISPRKTHTCACPSGFHLDIDDATCLYDLMSPRLYMIENEKLFHLHLERVGSNAAYRFPTTFHAIGDVTYNWLTGVLYVAEIWEHRISSINMTTYSSRPMFTESIGKIESIEFDWIGNNIYWLDTEKGTIEIASTDAHHRMVLIRGLSKCVDLVLHPQKGVMFLAVLGFDPHIAMYNMDGNNYAKLEEPECLPASLSIDYKQDRLYWANTHSSTISAIDIDKILTGPTVTVLRDIGNITSIAVGNKYIYWTDLVGGSRLNYADKLNFEKKTSIISSYNNEDNVTLKLDYVQPVFNMSSACENSNCVQFCIPLPSGHVCKCGEAFELATDSQSCFESSAACSNLFAVWKALLLCLIQYIYAHEFMH